MKKTKLFENDDYDEDQLIKDVKGVNDGLEELVKLTEKYFDDCERLAEKIGGAAKGPTMEAGMFAGDSQNAIEEAWIYEAKDLFNDAVFSNIESEWHELLDADELR